MKDRKNIWIILSCIVLIIGAFGYGYYTTIGKMNNQKPGTKPNARIDYGQYITAGEEEVNKVPLEDKVTPNTILEKKIISINTENQLTEYNDLVPDSLVNLTKKQVTEYFESNGYYKVEFSNGKITAVREMPYLPDRFVVILENEKIVAYKTDSKGIATRFEGFEAIPCKNKDERLRKGIEVDSEEQIYEKVQDYE